MRDLADQARLLISEWLIHLAVQIAPADHADTTAVAEAGWHVGRRPIEGVRQQRPTGPPYPAKK